MRPLLTIFLAAFAVVMPAEAELNLERGFDGALRGCEEWLLNPASWADGVGPFVEAVGLGERMGLVNRVDEANLPPGNMRKGNRYWRINSTSTAGYILVVSDQLPMCHITGGGAADLQPTVESVLASPAFRKSRQQQADLGTGDLASTEFRHREDPALSIVITRATRPGERQDRVQVAATATYALTN